MTEDPEAITLLAIKAQSLEAHAGGLASLMKLIRALLAEKLNRILGTLN